MSGIMLAWFADPVIRSELTINGRHNESDLHGVCGAGEMGIDLFRLMLVEGDESVENVVAGSLVVGTSCRMVRLHLCDQAGKHIPS